jgi:hypothetical protein
MRITLVKTVQNQRKHRTGRVIVIIENNHFLHPKLYEPFYLPPYVTSMILRFSPHPNSPHSQILRKTPKKTEPNMPIVVGGKVAALCSTLNPGTGPSGAASRWMYPLARCQPSHQTVRSWHRTVQWLSLCCQQKN